MEHSKSLKSLILLLVVAFTAQLGCSGQIGSNTLQSIPANEGGQSDETSPTTTTLPNDATPTTQAPLPPVTFCSYLSFSGVAWNAEFTSQEKRSFAISLSLSGSFEGSNGWKNLTNNFDGQGMSAGLLNQTLGTGSLQPLFSKLKTASRETYFDHLAQSRADSLISMVSEWERVNGGPQRASIEQFMKITSSKLDQDYVAPKSGENNSVKWAKATLYQSNGNFKPEWSTELKGLLGDPNYVTYQIEGAEQIHDKALQYVQRVKIYDLRTYLLMFDFIVQNGGIKEEEFKQVDGITDSTKKLLQLLEVRLKRANAQWRDDVRSRKKAIILGSGTVHGAARNFPKEYCFEQSDKIL